MSRLLLRISVGMLVVLFASLGIVRWGANRARVRRHFDSHVSTLLSEVERVRRALAAVPAGELERELARLQRGVTFPMRLHDGGDAALPGVVRERIARGQLVVVHTTPGAKHTLYLPIADSDKVLSVAPRRPDAPRDRIEYPIGVVAGAILAVVVLVGLGLAYPLARRLRRLERVTARLGAGDLGARAVDSSRDAIGSLAQRFNAMAAHIEQLLANQKQLLEAVSHELRTPVARIRFALEMLQGEEGEARRRRAEAIDADLEELDQLVEELLLYIRFGEAALELERSPLDTVADTRALVERLGEGYPAIDVAIEGDLERAVARVDPRYFRRAISNLLGNALRYATSAVTVRFGRRDEGWLEIAVADDGPGVPAELGERIFEPFARGDHSRSRQSGGVGLGLAIVKRIVVAHGGTVALESSPTGGARFVCRWPTC